jgi:hypothetical protein
MTSPVDTSVKHWHSGMANAPVLNGVAGSLIALLDACLKDGFDSKTLVSLVALSGVMTATFTGTHSSVVDSVVLIAGVTGGPSGFAGANGEQKVTVRASGTTAAWATALPDGTYTGTITMKMAPSTWAKSFTGTNLAAYKSTDVAATGFYLRVDDTNAQHARVIGYETMSDVNTGTGPFPTNAQVSGGGYWAKSTNANSTAVGWSLFTDGRLFYLDVQAGISTSTIYQLGALRGFGDMVGYRPGGDAYACVLNYSITASVSSMTEAQFNTNAGAAQFASPRDYTGLGTSALQSLYSFIAASTSQQFSGSTNSLGVLPSPVDGSMWLSEKYVGPISGNVSPRAKVPGIYHAMQSNIYAYFKQNDKTPGYGPLAGRQLMCALGSVGSSFTTAPDASNPSPSFIDVTGPWR